MSKKLTASKLAGLTKSELIALLLADDDSTSTSGDQKYITVMSLVPYRLNLSTLANGKGRLFTFNKFGEKKRLHVNDLVDVIEHYRSFVERGFFYIMNPQFVDEHGLTEVYASILSEDKMRKIVECNSADVVPLYEQANQTQRHFINELIIQRIVDGEQVDMNVIAVLSRIGGFDISAQAENRKSKFDELNKQE